MSEIRQLEGMIRNPAASVEQLRELLRMADEQLQRYRTAQRTLDDAGPEGWSYETFQEVMRVGSGGQTSTVTRAEWALLRPDQREQLRRQHSNNLRQGMDQFTSLRNLIQSEMAKRGEKKRWKFWK